MSEVPAIGLAYTDRVCQWACSVILMGRRKAAVPFIQLLCQVRHAIGVSSTCQLLPFRKRSRWVGRVSFIRRTFLSRDAFKESLQ